MVLKKGLLVGGILLLIGGQGVFAKKMYRWVDDQGRVFFSDQVPPDQIKHKREALNENARVLEVVEAAKTKEQIELEKRLAKLRRELQRIIAKQKSHDRVLLSTFRSLEDMQMAMDGKLHALDLQRKVAEGNLLRLEQQLRQQQRKAASFERNGQAVPKKLLQDILDSKQQIVATRGEIQRHLDKRQVVENDFEMDIARFKFLTQSKSADIEQLSSQAAEKRSAKELGLFICEYENQCDRAWNIARLFVKSYSTTGPNIDTDRLIMSAPPRRHSDLSLSVSRLKLNNREQIFLDIRCKQSTLGMELCISPEVKGIRYSFNDFIKQRLPASQ